MKKILGVFAVILCLAVSCQKYDDSQIKKDISDLQEQVASLKAWCESSQAAIDAVETLKKAVENFNGVSYVEYFSGNIGNGYTIGLDDGQEITIYNVKQEGSDAYLGNVIINQSSVVFTLSDGTSFSLPRKDGQVHFASYDTVTVNLLDTMEVLLPEGFTKADFAAFTAKVESGDGVATKAKNEDGWEVTALAPEFDEQGTLVKNPSVVFTGIPYERTSALLSVSIIDNSGNGTGTSRVIYSGNNDKVDEILFQLVTTKLASEEVGEFVQWYTQAVYGCDDQQMIGLNAKAFIADNREIIDILLRSDAQDPCVKSELKLVSQNPDEEMRVPGMDYPENEDMYDDDTPSNAGSRYNWMGYGYWNMSKGLPDNRLVCHVSMPGSYYSLTRDMLKDLDVDKLIPWKKLPFFKKLLLKLFGVDFLNKTLPDYAWNQFFRLRNQFKWGVRAFDFRIGDWGDQGIRGISPWTLRIDETLKIDEDIDIGDGQKVHIDSLYLGDIGLPFAAAEKFEKELTELLDYMKKCPTEFCVFFLSAADHSPATKQKIQNMIRYFKDKPEYSNMFLDFKKDLTVRNARGHVILIWKDDNVDSEMIGTPLWASVSDSDEQTKEAAINKWDGSKWVKEADFWIQDVYDFGIAQSPKDSESDGLRKQEAQKKLDLMRKMTQEYSDAVMKETPTPIWFENDATMQFFMYLPNWVKEKIFPKPYGNIQLSAHYFNKIAAREFLANYNRPAGMVFVNFACRRGLVWRAPGFVKCYTYGDEMIDNIIQLNGRYTMPYEK